MLRVAPAGSLLVEYARGGLGQRRHGLGAALAGERVSAGASELAVGEGRGPGLLERDEWEAAETELAAVPAHDEPLDPVLAAGRVDLKVQAVAVAVASGVGDVAHEHGRECVFRVSPVQALDAAPAEDREEMINLMEDLRDAIKEGRAAPASDLRRDLDEILFYLE